MSGSYSEGPQNFYAFNSSDPSHTISFNPAYKSQNVMFSDIDFDGAFLYMANGQVWSGENFVTKFDVNGAPAAFTTGTTIKAPYSWPKINMNGIDVVSSKTDSPNTIAVQNTGNILAVGYKNGVIKFFDKTTGASAGTPLTIAAPVSMGFTSAGLWVLSGGMVYLVTNLGTKNTLSTPIHGLSNPVSLATEKTSDMVWVLDGGASQQAKGYNSSYALVRTYGTAGGYLDWNPTITNDRLLVDSKATRGTNAPNGTMPVISTNSHRSCLFLGQVLPRSDWRC